MHRIFSLKGSRQWQPTLSPDRKIQTAGVYLVRTAGVTVTLETWNHWTDLSKNIVVVDQTGSQTPNIIVAPPSLAGSTLNNTTNDVILGNAGESIVFNPTTGGNNWSAS